MLVAIFNDKETNRLPSNRWDKEGNIIDGEHEFLINRGHKFRVVGVNKIITGDALEEIIPGSRGKWIDIYIYQRKEVHLTIVTVIPV